MRVRTPSTSAELALMEHSRAFQARRHGREPERIRPPDGSYGPLDLSDVPLEPTHPLYDSASDLRRKRVEMERARRGL
jgi:hypothetical protein